MNEMTCFIIICFIAVLFAFAFSNNCCWEALDKAEKAIEEAKSTIEYLNGENFRLVAEKEQLKIELERETKYNSELRFEVNDLNAIVNRLKELDNLTEKQMDEMYRLCGGCGEIMEVNENTEV